MSSLASAQIYKSSHILLHYVNKPENIYCLQYFNLSTLIDNSWVNPEYVITNHQTCLTLNYR